MTSAGPVTALFPKVTPPSYSVLRFAFPTTVPSVVILPPTPTLFSRRAIEAQRGWVACPQSCSGAGIRAQVPHSGSSSSCTPSTR